LERDRRTIGKALRRVEPDKVERGQKRYKLRTILDALDELPSANARHRNEASWVPADWLNPSNWRDKRIVNSLVEYNTAFAEMEAIEDIEQRRAFAIEKLAPLIAFHDKNFRDWEIDNPAPGRFWNDRDSVCARVSCLWQQQMEAAADACKWTHDEGREFLGEHFDDEEE
jgi:hypothetical protein